METAFKPTSATREWIDKDLDHYLQTFRRYPVVMDRARGVHIWDTEGRKYIDALAGIAVNNVGHCHPKVAGAIAEQARTLIHISNFYLSRPQARLSERLTALSGLDRVFLTNSGTESVEGAIKLARKFGSRHGKAGKILSFEGSFHGRTLAAIATGKKAMQAGFGPMPTGFGQLPFNDLEAAKEALDGEVAGILIEPIQGEGGIRPAKHEFLRGLRKLCDEHQVALIFDEIQCGIGRTGHWFAKDYYGVQPDIMTLAKALGGGVPIGAILCDQKIGDAIDYGDHGTTFGGNPLACAAALANLEVVEKEELCQKAAVKGKWLMDHLRSAGLPGVKEVRGLGLMIGVEFDRETKPIVAEMMERGVLANATAGNVLRLLPPLIIDQEDLETVADVIAASVESTLSA